MRTAVRVAVTSPTSMITAVFRRLGTGGLEAEGHPGTAIDVAVVRSVVGTAARQARWLISDRDSVIPADGFSDLFRLDLVHVVGSAEHRLLPAIRTFDERRTAEEGHVPRPRNRRGTCTDPDVPRSRTKRSRAPQPLSSGELGDVGGHCETTACLGKTRNPVDNHPAEATPETAAWGH